MKPKLAQCGVKLGVPCSRGLPQPVERFAQSEHPVLLSLDSEPWRLPDEDHFRQFAVEEGRFNVQVMDAPVLCCCQSQKQSDRLHARYRHKDFFEVDAITLDKASGDEARLVLDNGTVLVPFDIVHSLQADRTASWRWIDELPSLVFLDRLHLLQHCPSPVSIALG